MAYLNSSFLSGFSPQNIPGLALWLDAADSNSLVLSGTNVTTWRDKSGNRRDASGYNTTATYNANGLASGYPGLEFSSTKSMRATVPAGTFSNGVHGFAIYMFTGAFNGSAAYSLLSRTTSSAAAVPSPFDMYSFSVTSYRLIGDGTNYTQNSAGTTYISNTTPTIYNFWLQSSANTTWNDSINGTSSTYTTSGGTSAAYGDNGSSVVIGGRLDTAVYFQGVISEVILFSNALLSSQRQQLESYLGWKWGLRTNLPTAHPYRTAPPIMRPFVPLDISGCNLWLDAADARTIGMFSATDVSTWSDKSGGGYSAVNGIYNRPRYFSNVAKPYVLFGSNQSMHVSNWPYTTGWSVFTAQCNVAIGGGRWFISPYDTRGIVMMGFSNNKIFDVMPAQADASGDHIENTSAVNTGGTADYFYFRDGSQIASNNAARGNTAGTLTLGIGANGTGTDPLVASGNIINLYEMVIYDRPVSALERQQVETYLAEKWGLRSSISSGNPMRFYESLSPVFNPTLLSNCALWLDAADIGTLTLTGNNVTAWRDKSGNGNNATGSGGTTLQTFLGNNSGITLNGTDTFFSGSAANATSGLSAFVVATMGSMGATVWARLIALGRLDYNSNTNTIAFDRFSNSNQITMERNGFGTPALTFTPPFQFVGSAVYSSSAATQFINGTSNTSISGAYGSFNYTAYNIGRYSEGGYNWTGTICEVVLYNNTLTSAQRQLVEGYLANKWGIVSSLPSNHPYRTIRV